MLWSCDIVHWEAMQYYISTLVFLPKTYDLILIIQKHKENPSLTTFYKIILCPSSKGWRLRKMEELFQGILN
jgi:hypothetical protein